MGDTKILSYVRVICGLNLLVFQLFVIVPNFTEIYSTASFFSPSLDLTLNSGDFSFSGLAYFGNLGRLLFVAIWIGCSLGLIYGVSHWIFWVLLVLLNSQFHGLNPLIVHEPQQILNFLILILPFLNCTVYKGPELLDFKSGNEDKAPLEIGLLTFFLGFYYLLAGVKKIPILAWQQGYGFKETLSWNGIARPWLESIEPYFNNIYIDFILTSMNYSILVFEITFLLLVFTKYKRFLIPLGVTFQMLNLVLFDVGLFFIIMLSFYPVLISKSDVFDFLKSLKNSLLLRKDTANS